MILYPTFAYILVAFVTLLSPFTELTEPDLAQNYIQAHKHYAISEMYRTGIPASITLAQGLHESNNGQSKLATLANNHFGIKCKKYWKGKTYYHKDDDYDKKGRLTDSCFRAYGSTVDSYIDHSNFLQTTDHYRFIFDYKHTDYLNWAHGLKKAGYATDPDYALKLIKKIESYKLYDYDYFQKPVKKY